MNRLICAWAALALLLVPSVVGASVTLIVGTPADSLLAVPSGPSLVIGNQINFDNLTPNSTFDPNTYAAQGVTISSPDGLIVLPYSTQSFPNYLFDNSPDGTANITIALTNGTSEIGIGIADSDDPANVTLQALGLGGVSLGSPFQVTIPENTNNPGNGYFAIKDTSSDIYGLRITETDGGPNYSGLAIDDLQTAAVPEPATLTLLGIGVVGLAAYRRRRG